MTIGATPLRLYPGRHCSPIALGEEPAKLITNQRRTGEERTPGYVISSDEWSNLVAGRPQDAPPKDKVQYYQVNKARDPMYPKILWPAANEAVHTFLVALGTMTTSRAHYEQLDLAELDYSSEEDVAWAAVIVPADWYEQMTGANMRTLYEAGAFNATNTSRGEQ